MGVLAKPAGKRANKPGFKKDKKLPGQHGQFKKSPDKFKGKKNVPKKFEKKTELSNDDTDVQRKKGTKRKQLELSSEEKKRVRFSDQLDDRNRDSDADEDESVDQIEDEDVEDENVSDEEVSEAEAEEEEEKGDEGFKGETLDSQAEASVEPKKSSKELRREQKKIKQDRKMRKNKFFELATQAKQIWEEVRPADCPKEKRVQLIDQLTSQIKGSVKEIIRAHDTVRVVECIVQHGSDKHRTMMFDELKDMIVDLSMSKYGRFFVLKMLKYGSRDQKAKIISSFYGHVTKLLKHKEAALVVETAYNEVANAKQRALLVQEFYGPEFKVFKDDTTVTLEQVLEKASESQKKKILTTMKDMLVKMTEKSIFRHSITHFLLRELFKHADDGMKLELVESLKEVVVELVHTKDGARVAMECLWASPAKERKSVLKSFRKFVPKMVEEEHGYLVLLAAFDCVDDTKLIDKTILVELFSAENALSLAQYKNGLKVLHYLLTPRDSRHFHKDVVAILEAGDKNPHSKKEVDIRRKELLEASSPHLFRLVANHADVLVQNNGCALLMIDILTLAVDSDGLKAAAMDKIVSIIASEGLYHSAKEDSNRHPIERDGLGLFLSKMVSKEADKFAAEKKNGVYFSSKLADKVSKEVLRSYIGCNKGCFVLLKLIETKIPSVVTKVTSALQGVNRTLAQKDYKGASLLLEKLKASK